MLKRALYAALLVAIVSPTLRAAEEPKTPPTIVVRIQSLDKLLDNTTFLADIVDQAEFVKQVRGIVESRIGDKGFDGIDTKKPIALYGTLGDVLTNSSAVLMLPIADEKAFLALLARQEISAEKGSDGIYVIKEGQKVPIIAKDLPTEVYFRFANNYLYATARDREAIEKGLLKPEAIFPKQDFGVVAVEFRVDQIPDDLKKSALVQLETQLGLLKDKKDPGETTAKHDLKVQILDSMFTQIKAVFDDGEQVTLRLDVDQKNKDIILETSLTAKKGSHLAGDIADLAKSKSLAAAVLSTNAALSGSTRLTLPKDLSKALAVAVEEEARENLKNEKNEGAHKLGENLLDSLLPTLKAGEIDLAFELRGPSTKGAYTFVAAGALKNGKDLEKSLRDIAKSLPESARDRIKLDADSADGIAIHSVDVLKDADEDAHRVLGDGPLYLALREDALFISVGENGLADLKSALKAKAGKGAPLQFTISVSRLGPLMEKDQPSAPKVIEKVFGKNKDSDKIRVSVEGGDSLRAQIKVKTDAARFFAKMSQQNK